MKKITKLLVVSALLAAMFTMPVMAREVSFSSDNTDYLITLLNNNTAKLQGELARFVSLQQGPGADATIAAQTALVNNKIAVTNKECAENHIAMLSAKVYNLTQLQATRQKQLAWFQSLAQTSSTWNDEVASAQKEYDSVSAELAAAQQYLADAKVKLAPFM